MLRKILLAVVACVCVSSAFTAPTVPYRWVTTKDTLTPTKLNKNNDTIYNAVRMLSDTVKYKYPRWVQFKDTTIDLLKTDSLRCVFYAAFDSIFTRTLKATGFMTCDSLNVRSINSAVINSVSFVGNLVGDIIGNVTGTADSAKGCNHLTGGAVSATTGVFSRTVNVDSLHSTNGLNATNGIFSNKVSADSIYVRRIKADGNVAINGGSFVGNLIGDVNATNISADSMHIRRIAATGNVATDGTFVGSLLGPVSGNVSGGYGALDSLSLGGGPYLGKIVIDTGTTAASGASTQDISPGLGILTKAIVLSVMINYGGLPTWGFPLSYGSTTGVGVIVPSSGGNTKYSIYYPDHADWHSKHYKVVFAIQNK